jgi:RNA polymerase sigma factor (sigma-70 family)
MEATLSKAVQQLRKLVLAHPGGDVPDGELLRRFVARQDESAFAALVRRHGPLVLGVCRRILRNRQDAEDAFQATFLVLVRRAGSIRKPASLASWLHGVARRTALTARRAAARRRAKESQVMPRADRAAEAPADLAAVLDEELAGLPEKYREAIVLCDLEGRPRREAARVLGCAEGTVASRVARGRALLAGRLARRGPALSAGALALLLAQGAAPACVPAALVGSTVKAALLVAAGKAAAAGALAAPVAALMEGVLKAMLLNKLKAATAVLLGAGVLVAATSLLVVPAVATGAPDDANRAEARRAAPPTPRGKDTVNDADFIRRACLDIRGSLPSAIEVHYFLRDRNPNKRAWLVERLQAEAVSRDEDRKAKELIEKMRGQRDRTPGSAADREAGAAGLEGTWEVTRFVDQRRDMLAKLGGDRVEAVRIIIRGDRLAFRMRLAGQQEKPGGEFAVRLDPSRRPKAIDLIALKGPHEGEPLRGIYEVDGDTLLLCFRRTPSQARPTEFNETAEAGVYLFRARRSGPAGN